MTPRVLLFAKAPLPGYAKTRLIPELGRTGAARFHQRLVLHCLHTVLQLDSVTVELHYSEPHPFFWRVARRHDITLVPQTSGNLGARMLAALRHQAAPALILGSDCPIISVAQVRKCINALKQWDTVILPAEDGGYGLIACREPRQDRISSLFTEIPWGTSEVLAHTRQAAQRAGIALQELDTVWDIDTPDDLHRWRELCIARQEEHKR